VSSTSTSGPNSLHHRIFRTDRSSGRPRRATGDVEPATGPRRRADLRTQPRRRTHHRLQRIGGDHRQRRHPDSLATRSGLFAKMVQRTGRAAGGHCSATSPPDQPASASWNTGAVFSETGKMLPSVVPQFIRLIANSTRCRTPATTSFGTDEAVGDLVGKLGVYVDTLAVAEHLRHGAPTATAAAARSQGRRRALAGLLESTFSDARRCPRSADGP